jgi:hypothetical protein
MDKWFNISGSNGSMLRRRIRDSIAGQMTSAQIAEAQNLAREWIAAHPKKIGKLQ